MFYAKKSLGQNFLKSKGAIRSIVAAGNISNTDTILEIGPGKGVLTEALLEKAGRVIAIEKDQRLIELLTEKFRTQIDVGKLKLIEGDATEIEPTALGLSDHSYKLIANIPYYVTGFVIRKFLETTQQPERMVLMVQKEVADRTVARDNKESLLSISVKAYGTPHYIEKVPAKYFSPVPNVDSAILLIDTISKNLFIDISETDFFAAVKQGFAHKRKKVIGNLTESRKDLRDSLISVLISHGLPETARPENVALPVWREIATLYQRDTPK
mgnify:CR=1 FL=1